MSGYLVNIEKETMENQNFRKVLHTAENSQLVVMSLLPGEEIGDEVHHLDQFIRLEAGQGELILDGQEHLVAANWAAVIPAGTRHNVINVSASEKLKLYTIYSPPQHPAGTIQATRAEAMAAEERP